MTLFRHSLRYLLMAMLLVIPVIPLPAAGQEVPELQIHSKRYIVIDAATGEVYAQRNADEEVAIASLTKLFTAVQAVNMAPLSTPITTTQSDLRGPDSTTMGFGPGETYTLEDMLYGLLLPSGNDAAHAIARTLGYQDGDTDKEAVDRFMALVNQRVQNMGLTHTHLMNPDGWGVPGHYSSAADVAAFMQYVNEYPRLVEIMGTRSYTTSNGLITVTNTNKLMSSYSSLIAGKTGYDDDAGWCLVILAGSGGSQMIAVTLDGIAPDDWYDDNRTLLEYGFQRKAELANAGTGFNGDVIGYTDPDRAQLANATDRSAEIAGPQPADSDLTPPESHGEIVSRVPAIPPLEFTAPGPWLAGIATVALIGFRGAITWRDILRKQHA